ncbi:MAG: helix-turn-helix transcriptional regulator [Rhizomicrobium sp.]
MLHLAAARFFGSRSCAVAAPGIEAALRQATIPPDRVAEHCHGEDAHFVLALDPGYVTAARDAPVVSAEPVLIFNPLQTVHRDRYVGPGCHFLAVSIARARLSEWSADLDLPREPVLAHGGMVAARRMLGHCIAGADRFAVECETLALLQFAAPGRRDRHLPWMPRALAFLRDAKMPTVNTLAAAAGVHPVHLGRGFRQAFGCTPSSYLQRLRLERAAARLRRTDLSLAGIADASGFSDQSHMTRAFRAAYRTTPARYRAAFRQVRSVQDACGGAG